MKHQASSIKHQTSSIKHQASKTLSDAAHAQTLVLHRRPPQQDIHLPHPFDCFGTLTGNSALALTIAIAAPVAVAVAVAVDEELQARAPRILVAIFLRSGTCSS